MGFGDFERAPTRDVVRVIIVALDWYPEVPDP